MPRRLNSNDIIFSIVPWAILRSYGVAINLLQNICEILRSAVRARGAVGEWFKTAVGAKQGDPISPTTFISYRERVMDANKDNGKGVYRCIIPRAHNGELSDWLDINGCGRLLFSLLLNEGSNY